MNRYPCLYASGLSSGMTFASLVTFLAGINWPGLVVLVTNLAVSYFSWLRAREEARLEARRHGEWGHSSIGEKLHVKGAAKGDG